VRAAMLLESLGGDSDEVIARRHRVSRATVILCIRKCLEFGLEAALNDLPRPGKPRQLPDDAIAWVLSVACQKPKDLGYSYELWTYDLLTRHVREHCGAAGFEALRKLSHSKLHKILHQGEIRPHKVRYYVERRDPAFESKMANVLHVYKEVELINELRSGQVSGAVRELGMVTISYDEKPGIQALAVTTPDRPPVVGKHRSHLRDYEYERLGTVSLLAGLDLHSGAIIETVSDTHTSADFIAFLQKLDRTYPQHQIIRLVLDNHSAHISKDTRAYLDAAERRFDFVFTPKHGSWLNLIETQFSKMTRTMLRGIRVTSKQELVDRIHRYYDEINSHPVVFRWKYKMDETFIV
jgi:transposase